MRDEGWWEKTREVEEVEEGEGELQVKVQCELREITDVEV